MAMKPIEEHKTRPLCVCSLIRLSPKGTKLRQKRELIWICRSGRVDRMRPELTLPDCSVLFEAVPHLVLGCQKRGTETPGRRRAAYWHQERRFPQEPGSEDGNIVANSAKSGG
jgi:hypothetical protein